MGCHSFGWWGLVYAVSFLLYLTVFFFFFEAMESVIDFAVCQIYSFSFIYCTSYLCVVYHVDDFHFTSLALVNCSLYVELV